MSRMSTAVAVIALLLSLPPAARADVVLEWNAVMLTTTTGQNPFAQARFAAITHAAVFEAVNAITGQYEPYLGQEVWRVEVILVPVNTPLDTGAELASHPDSAAAITIMASQNPILWVCKPIASRTSSAVGAKTLQAENSRMRTLDPFQ